MALRMKMTYHAEVERIDRLVACVEYLGVGDVVLEEIHNDLRHQLTSTGLCLLFSLRDERLVTGYMCSVKKCVAMYSACGYEKVPANVFKTVVRNNKKYTFLSKM